MKASEIRAKAMLSDIRSTDDKTEVWIDGYKQALRDIRAECLRDWPDDGTAPFGMTWPALERIWRVEEEE